QPRTSCVGWRTPMDVLCVLNRQLTWAKITRTVHGKGQRVESKDQRADMCTDRQPRTSLFHGKGQRAESKDQRADIHGRPVCAGGHLMDTHGHTRTATDILCVLTDTHGRHPQTSCVYCTDSPRGPKSPEQSTGCVSVLSPRTNMLIYVLMDSHGRPVCADGHTRTHTDSHTATDVLCVMTDTHGRPVCADGDPQTSCMC
ncbi:unnamed protein product, partial [Brassica rapa]